MNILAFVKKAYHHPDKIVTNLGRRGLLSWMSDEAYIKLLYYAVFKRMPDLEHPKTFNEKLQWLKLHDRNPLYTTLVDKYEVKNYVAGSIGEEYVIPTLGVWDSFDEIDFNALPDQFVLKCTHDSGGGIICKDKKELDLGSARKKINRSLRQNFYYFGREWPYKDVKPRIIAEEYLQNDENEGLHDYKVWCFNGEPRFIQYVTGRLRKESYEVFFDLNWKAQPFLYHNPRFAGEVPRPEQLEELVVLARELAKDKAFARCDFYILPDGKLKFGEITFYPVSGYEIFDPADWDDRLGTWLKLPEVD